VKLIRSALQRQVDRSGAGMADLRIVCGSLDLELLNCVGRRLNAGSRLGDDVARSVDGELTVDRAGDRHPAQVVVVHRPLEGVRPLE
jgi:hypothetical protein